MAPKFTDLRDEFKLTTFLYVGALLQSLLFLIYPQRITALPCLLVISYRFSRNLLIHWGYIPDVRNAEMRKGRYTAQIVDENGSKPKEGSDKDVVVFMLGARPNSTSLGRFAPGMELVGSQFEEMWKDASVNAEKWGFLGKTSTLIASDDDGGNVMLWISYWKTLDHLQKFANGDSHRKGWDSWNRGEHPNLGIMHETYFVPAGHWETIYHNFVPFGLGQIKQPVEAEKSDGEKVEYASGSGFMEAKGTTWRTMKSRMRRLAAETSS